jgi:hypothetical protein
MNKTTLKINKTTFKINKTLSDKLVSCLAKQLSAEQ